MTDIRIIVQPVSVTLREKPGKSSFNPDFWRYIAGLYQNYASKLEQWLSMIAKPEDEKYAWALEEAKANAAALCKKLGYMKECVEDSVTFENCVRSLFFNEYFVVGFIYMILCDTNNIKDNRITTVIDSILEHLDTLFDYVAEDEVDIDDM